jgi:aminotransferase
VNRSLVATRPHRSKQISDAVAGDPTIVDLTVGEPSYGPPGVVSDTLAALVAVRTDEPSVPHNHYAPGRGTTELRAAISAWYRRAYGLEVDPETEILVTHGAAEALWLSVFTLTEPGDEVLMPDPCYMLYEPITTALGRVPVRVPTVPEDGFALDPEQVERAVTARTRALLVNSPANPTGTVLEPETVARLVELAAERGFHVVHDEVFDCLVYEGEHVPAIAVPGGREHALVANSFSKRFGITGWRLGWLAGPAAVLAEAAKAHTLMTLAVARLPQVAVAAALAEPAIEEEVTRNCRRLRERGRRFLDELLALGFSCPGGAPRCGFYLFLRPDALADGDGSGETFAHYLLREARVAVVPGRVFGPAGDAFVRFSYAGPQDALDRALERLAELPALVEARAARAR